MPCTGGSLPLEALPSEVDRGSQVGQLDWLREIRLDASRVDTLNHVRRVIGGDQDHRHWILLTDFFRRMQAVQFRHLDVGDDEIGILQQTILYQLAAVR